MKKAITTLIIILLVICSFSLYCQDSLMIIQLEKIPQDPIKIELINPQKEKSVFDQILSFFKDWIVPIVGFIFIWWQIRKSESNIKYSNSLERNERFIEIISNYINEIDMEIEEKFVKLRNGEFISKQHLILHNKLLLFLDSKITSQSELVTLIKNLISVSNNEKKSEIIQKIKDKSIIVIANLNT